MDNNYDQMVSSYRSLSDSMIQQLIEENQRLQGQVTNLKNWDDSAKKLAWTMAKELDA